MATKKRFEIFIAAAARKELKKLGASVAQEILRQIDKKLSTEPAEYGEPLHADLAGYYKLRVSGFRVVYRIVEQEVKVLVLAAGKREEGNIDNIYDWLRKDLLDQRGTELLAEIEKKKKREAEEGK